jgi:tetratricopeptide (TPR) repeat protein
VAVAIALVSSQLAIPCAQAAPKTSRARAEFDRGVKAYQHEDYATAALAFSASYDAEADTETLFAWAQAERHRGRCDTAIELYDRLLGGALPAANRAAIQKAKSECQAIVTSGHTAEPHSSGSDTPVVVEEGSGDEGSGSDEGSDVAPVVVRHPRYVQRAWWQDPIGDIVTGAGVVGLFIGAVNYLEYRDKASALDGPQTPSETDAEVEQEVNRANNDRGLAIGGTVVGGVLVVGGVVWYVTHRREETQRPRHVVTGWLAPRGGGVTVMGSW